MWFFIFWVLSTKERKKEREEEKKAYTRTRSSSCTSLRPFTTRFDEIDRRTTTRRSRCPVGGRKRRKREEEEEEEERRRKKKEEEEVVRKKYTNWLIQKDSNRDLIKRRVATSREVDRHEYDATNLHSEPPPFIFLPCDAFYFGLRDVFRACFFCDFLNARDAI